MWFSRMKQILYETSSFVPSKQQLIPSSPLKGKKDSLSFQTGRFPTTLSAGWFYSHFEIKVIYMLNSALWLIQVHSQNIPTLVS